MVCLVCAFRCFYFDNASLKLELGCSDFSFGFQILFQRTFDLKFEQFVPIIAFKKGVFFELLKSLSSQSFLRFMLQQTFDQMNCIIPHFVIKCRLIQHDEALYAFRITIFIMKWWFPSYEFIQKDPYTPKIS